MGVKRLSKMPTKEINEQKKEAKDWFKKGNSLQRKKKYEEAIECYDRAIELDPESAYMTHLNLLARLSRILHAEGLLPRLIASRSPGEAIRCITECEGALDQTGGLALLGRE